MPCFHWLTRLTGLLGGLLGLVVVSSTAVAGKASPPSLPPIDVLAAVQVGRHPLGVAVYSNSPGQALAVVANRNSSNISIVDLLNLSRLSEFEVGSYPTGVDINAATGVAVVTLGVEHTAAVVDLVHATILRKIAVGRKPEGVAIDPSLNVAVVANTDSNTVSLIDLHTLVATTQLSVGKKPLVWR